MKTIGLAPNPHKKEAVQLAAELADWLAERPSTGSGRGVEGSGRVEVRVVDEIAAAIGKPELAASEEAVADVDLLLVLGGDGTMLRWNRLAARYGAPMMGVNFGQYGFITEIHPADAKAALTRVLEGDFFISERTILEARVTRDERQIGAYHALNDAVVSKGTVGRMLDLHTYVNDKFIVTYTADGIIVATPTGSTAYSLSAGGPVVHPNVCVLVITPICPHTLNARSLVIPDDETVKIVAGAGEDGVEMILTMDGQVTERLKPRDMVEIGKADFTAKLIQLEPQSFYNKLQTRLHWGERFSGKAL